MLLAVVITPTTGLSLLESFNTRPKIAALADLSSAPPIATSLPRGLGFTDISIERLHPSLDYYLYVVDVTIPFTRMSRNPQSATAKAIATSRFPRYVGFLATKPRQNGAKHGRNQT
ncbi:hypothetical protein [Roseovarius atlanticus]|uniref:hypothetical protein n=1 Tax=Roseovarius atlanticus TaxID=1641875 RepID=UPI0021BDA806|nr:hypothetical protein [Roseovarius atlanticus]